MGPQVLLVSNPGLNLGVEGGGQELRVRLAQEGNCMARAIIDSTVGRVLGLAHKRPWDGTLASHMVFQLRQE